MTVRILGITFEIPGEKGGGAIVIKQSLISLIDCGDVDYVCPENHHPILQKCHKVSFLRETSAIIKRLYYLFTAHATSCYFESWKAISSSLDWSNYDVVCIDKTQEPYFLRDAKKHGLKTIVRAHNVEYDYYKNLYRISPTLRNFIRSIYAKKNEAYILKNADKILCITAADKRRFIELYGVDDDKLEIVPVCLDANSDEISSQQRHVDDDAIPDKQYLLITGSLWYGPNAEGVLWFIENVWQHIPTKVKQGAFLVCAGARPSDEIKQTISKYHDIQLVDTPPTMDPYFRHALAYVAPILSGAGMKVKVAEALSYGLTVFGTPHALLGYDMRHGLIKVESAVQYKDALIKFLKNQTALDSAEVIINEYKEKYTLQVSKQKYRKILTDLIKG